MATITGLTAERMQEIIDATITDADVVAGHLILTLHDGSTIDAGVVSPAIKATAFPATATDGDLVVRIDQVGDPLYKYTDGAWALVGGGGGGLAKVTSFPGAPADGDVVVRTDLNGSPMFAYSTENGWEQQPRMGAQTVPHVKVRRSTAQSIPSGGGNSVLAFDVEDADTDTLHDMVTNTGRLTIKTPGVYAIHGHVEWAAAGGGARGLYIAVNGVVERANEVAPNAIGDNSDQEVNYIRRFAAGDYIEFQVWHNNGSSINIMSIGSRSPAFSATWLGGPGQTVDERGVPAVSASITAAQSIPSAGAESLVLFNGEDFDTDGMHDPATNNSRLTIKTPGLYVVRATADWAVNSTGTRRVHIGKNAGGVFGGGSEVGRDSRPTGPYGQGQTAIAVLNLAAGDYLEMFVYHEAGAALNLQPGLTRFSATMIGSAKTVTPFARARFSVDTGWNLGTGSWYPMSLDIEESDNDGIHDTVTNNTRLVCRTAGTYVIVGSMEMTNDSTTRLEIRKNANGDQTQGTKLGHGGSPHKLVGAAAIAELAVGDYVELFIRNDGSNQSIIGSRSSFSMVKVGAPNAGVLGGLAGAPPPASYAWPVMHNDVNDTYRTGATKTFTAPTAGVYKVTLQSQFYAAAAFTYEERTWSLATTGTRLDNVGQGSDWAPDSSEGNAHATVDVIVALAAGQTVTIQPMARAGGMNINAAGWYFSMLAQYIGATHDDSQIT